MDAIASGRLVTLLDEHVPPPVPVHLVYQANRGASVNVRAFIDAARARFKGLYLGGDPAARAGSASRITAPATPTA
jgi:DNA-binding transcriptional LysR family regulator